MANPSTSVIQIGDNSVVESKFFNAETDIELSSVHLIIEGGGSSNVKLMDYAKGKNLNLDEQFYKRFVWGDTSVAQIKAREVTCVSREFLVAALNDPNSGINVNPKITKTFTDPIAKKVMSPLRDALLDAASGLYCKLPEARRLT